MVRYMRESIKRGLETPLDACVSSGNIFEDMSLPNAQERLAKSQLASKIVEIAQKKHLTQKKMATFLNVDQPKISALYHGRLTGFSIFRLIRFLILLEQDVEITVKDKSSNYEPFGHLTVVSSNNHPHVSL